MRARYFPMAASIGALFFGSPSQSLADDLRCGSHIVQTGDPADLVARRCGEPISVSHQSILRSPSVFRNGRRSQLSGDLVEVPVEVWTYNFGPNKLMRRLRFVDGLLEDIETLGYGYNPDF